MFEKINAAEAGFKVFDMIGKRQMLICARKPDGKFNAMTASWGGMGVLWNKEVFFCFIRPQRYTNEFAAEAGHITLSFLQEKNKNALTVCGTKSGRDCDKIKEAGLTPVVDGDGVYFEEAELVIVGKKLYADVLKKEGFIRPEELQLYKNDYHFTYVCQITEILRKK